MCAIRANVWSSISPSRQTCYVKANGHPIFHETNPGAIQNLLYVSNKSRDVDKVIRRMPSLSIVLDWTCGVTSDLTFETSAI